MATIVEPKQASTTVRLTEYARCAGCAAKMGAADLAAVLSTLSPRSDPRLLVGHATFDDAAIFEIAPGIALVQTVDFFAPIVDDPFDFGRVAAANALSDVYAMGGEPLTALAITAFPSATLAHSVLADILRGGESMVHEAGALIVGGHTITDEEVKFGLAVTGRVDPAHCFTNANAKPGDVLLLTKPIGTGILATQAKRGRLDANHNASLIASMTTLNAKAAAAARAVNARAATDVTGFGLLGHSLHMARASNVTLRIRVNDIPLLPGVLESLNDGAKTGGAERNEKFVSESVNWGGATQEQRAILLDPQTSGGLLIALDPKKVAEFQDKFSSSAVVGSVSPRASHPLIVE